MPKPPTVQRLIQSAQSERLAEIAAQGPHERQLVEAEVVRRIKRFADKYAKLGLVKTSL